ncbi:hypothetical protein RMATCC62417_10838 [Rhizopus microsporus]|nr:hypothetical protein RMATCC62417_10838 [Rhizopus microsporus]
MNRLGPLFLERPLTGDNHANGSILLNAADPNIFERGLIPVYLSLYSPELNPILMLWKVLKDQIRRGELTEVETLSSRVIEDSEDVPVGRIQISSSIRSMYFLNA